MYKVIHFFTDLQDNNYPYSEGDIFPRDGVTVTEERIAELSGNQNKQKKPLIEPVKEEKEPLPFEPKKYTKTEINRMSTAELQNLAAAEGIDGAFDMTGGDLKPLLIEHFGL